MKTKMADSNDNRGRVLRGWGWGRAGGGKMCTVDKDVHRVPQSIEEHVLFFLDFFP